jgi:hypothetical protein
MKPRAVTARPKGRGPTPPAQGRGIVAKLARAVEASRLTPYAIAKNAGVNHRTLGRFLTGERGIQFDTAARLANALGLDLVDTRRRGGTAGGERAAGEVEADQAVVDPFQSDSPAR